MSKYKALSILMLSTSLLISADNLLASKRALEGVTDDTIVQVGRKHKNNQHSDFNEENTSKYNGFFGGFFNMFNYSGAKNVMDAQQESGNRELREGAKVLTQLAAASTWLNPENEMYDLEKENVAIQSIHNILAHDVGTPKARLTILSWINEQRVSDENRMKLIKMVLSNPKLAEHYLTDPENRSFENSSYFQNGYLNALSQDDELLSLLKSDHPAVAIAAADACRVMAQEVCLSQSNLRFKAGIYLLGTEEKDAQKIMELVFTSRDIPFQARLEKLTAFYDSGEVFSQVASKSCAAISASHKETFEDRRSAANLPYTKLGVSGLEETFQNNLSILFDGTVDFQNRTAIANSLKSYIELNAADNFTEKAVNNYIMALAKDTSADSDSANVNFIFNVFNTTILPGVTSVALNHESLSVTSKTKIFSALLLKEPGLSFSVQRIKKDVL
ncbi:MAG: hypothetical protein K2X53_00860 [Alphaproteobacteria bacterium]|nr:hypothetical protein [Alphaproteobacteria bacterium]